MAETRGATATEVSERLNAPISTGELERRWAAVRDAMAQARLDVLVMQNNSESLGGYVRWFTDAPAFPYPISVVFPREAPMTVVMHGPLGERELPAEGDGIFRGVERVIGTASFPSIHYTRAYDAQALAPALEPFARGSIGLLRAHQLSHATEAYLAQHLPGARFAEAADLVDEIKAIKSEEEQELIRATATMQDEVMEIAVAAVEPGRKESEVTAVARQAAHERGSEAGFLLSGAGPVGQPAGLAPRHRQNRVLREGDVLMLLIEVDGPGGLYAELGRTCTVGPAPARMKEELEFTLARGCRARRVCRGPLPEGHPFWMLDNVLITPHTAGFHVGYADEALPIVEENLRRFLAGDTEHLMNIVRT
jgi:Xaa-Pro aminopeptidase